MDFLQILKLVLLVLGIIAVGALIVWGLVTLILKIIEPHGNGSVKNDEYVDNQITYERYEPVKLVENTKSYEEENTEEKPQTAEDVKDVDLDKAKQEEEALNNASPFEELEAEEQEFIKAKQKGIEERLASKDEEDVNVDDIYVDDDENEENENEDDDIEDLINKILDGDNEEEVEEQPEEEPEEIEEAEETEEEPVEEVEEDNTTEEPTVEEITEEPAEIVEENNEANDRIKELEEELARQKQEYEEKLKAIQEIKVEEEKVAPVGSIEDYEARLEVLRERLKVNEKDLKKVKKDFIPLYKINKTLERDNIKLRRKEALVAKQKVVLYGVNNYVDIDEEKAKKLSEDLDLLEGLRLSVQHCEEVMKANEDRYPILESSYNSLLATNENIKADIKECTDKIEELKAAQDNGEND